MTKIATPKKEEARDDVTLTELYKGKVIVKFYEKSHQYWVSRDGGKTFKRKTGVTTYLNVKDKSTALMSWQQSMTVDFLLEQLAKGVVIDTDRAIEACVQHEIAKDHAADIGTEIHGFCETWIRHTLKQKGFESLPEMPNFPEAVTGVNAFMEWLDEHKVKFISTETPVYSLKHDYIGTEDVTFIADGIYCDADFKSSNGLYNTVRMQTAAYAHARMEEGGKECRGRWAIRFSKYTETEYYKREARKGQIKQAIARFKGNEVKEYPVKPYQVFEAAFLDRDPRSLDKDFKAFLTCKELTEWDRATDSFYNGGLEETKYQ